MQDEQRKFAEMVENATKRKKDALLIDRQRAVVQQAAELAAAARAQARDAWELAEEAVAQMELARRALGESP